jgi:hypothetical protein
VDFGVAAAGAGGAACFFFLSNIGIPLYSMWAEYATSAVDI